MKLVISMPTRGRPQQLIETVKNKQWIAYSIEPFGEPEQVLEYPGRYTHHVAITNNRIVSLKNDRVTFTYKDRSDKKQGQRTNGERRRIYSQVPPAYSSQRIYENPLLWLSSEHKQKRVCPSDSAAD